CVTSGSVSFIFSLYCQSYVSFSFSPSSIFFFFFFTDTATTEFYTLSLHDALPILLAMVVVVMLFAPAAFAQETGGAGTGKAGAKDRKSTRLNSSHRTISYAVFCLKKKKHAKR